MSFAKWLGNLFHSVDGGSTVGNLWRSIAKCIPAGSYVEKFITEFQKRQEGASYQD